uniref:Uncharacterized protein n=1 Tax=viral metagenome TaxID=1070528 RepID=A0A6C0HDE2_9ZZZZ
MFQLFIVFHKKIFDDCYKNIPNDLLYQYFTFVAVNKTIPKEYTKDKYKIINEWELSIYDDSFQLLGYNENSAIYHIYANKLHKKYKHIGFFQYDMIFNDNIVNFLINRLEKEESIYFSLDTYDFNFCSYRTWNEPRTMEYIIQDYEKYFGIYFDRTKKYPLCNSFIIEVGIYEKIMGWVIQLYKKLYPWCIQPPNRTHFGHIGGIYERIMAYAIGCENLKQINLNISHDNNYKKFCY